MVGAFEEQRIDRHCCQEPTNRKTACWFRVFGDRHHRHRFRVRVTGCRAVGSGHPIKSSSFAGRHWLETTFAGIEAIEFIHAFVLGSIACRAFGQILDAFHCRHVAICVIDTIDHRTVGANEAFRDTFRRRHIADVVETITREEAVWIARRAMGGRYGTNAHARTEIDVAACGALASVESQARLSRGRLCGTGGRITHHVRLTVCPCFAIGHHARFTDFRWSWWCRDGRAFAWTALHHAGRIRLAVLRFALSVLETVPRVGHRSFKYG